MARAARSLAVTTSPPSRSNASVSAAELDPIPALYAAGPGSAKAASLWYGIGSPMLSMVREVNAP